jgi:hypothetical protein
MEEDFTSRTCGGIEQSPKVIKEALAYAEVTGDQDKST